MDRNTLVRKLQERISVEGRQSVYNPLLQKPTMLNPIGPGSYPGGLGGYAYIGPPPDFGGSYGSYEDAGGRKQVGIRASKMFSIHDGSHVQLHAELSPEERQALVTQLEEASESHKCPACRSELTISMPAELESVHCPHCGTQLDGVAEKIKQCVSKLQEKKSMAKSTVVKSDITQFVADPAKEAGKALEPRAMGADIKPEAAPMIAPQPAAEKDQPMKELDGGLKAANEGKLKAEQKANGIEPGGVPTPPAAVKSAAVQSAAETKKRRERLKAALSKYQRSKRTSATAGVDLDAKTRIAAKREFRIMATFEPVKFAALKKNAKLAPLCAEVEKKLYTKAQRAQIRAELATLSAEDAEAAGEMKKKLEFVAPEILMEDGMEEKHAHGAEGEEGEEVKADLLLNLLPTDKDKDKDKDKDEKAKAAAPVMMAEDEEAKKAKADAYAMMSEDEKAKADAEKDITENEEKEQEQEAMSMKTEFLASLANLTGERVEMSLYGEESENPFWNLTVDSEPVGRIYLGDQQDSQNIRSSFTSDAYAENFGNAIGKVGVERMLGLAKARLYAHEVDAANVTARLREKAKTEARAEFEEKLVTLRQDFKNAMTVAMIATDKNYFQGEGAHQLKGGLFNALVQAGLESTHAVAAIESGFADAPAYWDFIMSKATELMDMPKEARESFEKNVLASGNIEITVQQDPGSEEQQIMNRLVRSSVETLAKGGVVSGEDRKEIAARLGFGAFRR